jgi:hypothetical protein
LPARNFVEAAPEDNDDDADESFFIKASRDAYMERMRLLGEGRTLAAMSYQSSSTRENETDADVVPPPPSSVDDAPRKGGVIDGERSSTMPGALGGEAAPANDDWGSIVVPDGTEVTRRTVTLAEALSIGDMRARESISHESSSITIDVKEEEVGEVEEVEEEAEKEMEKSEDEVVEVEEMQNEIEMEIEKYAAELDKEEEVAKEIDRMMEKYQANDEEETTPTIDSDGTNGSTTPLGTTSDELLGAGDDKSIMTLPESEETPGTDPRQQRRLSSDGKEIFEPSESPSSSSTDVNQDNVDVGLFVLTRTLFALKSILDKD